MSLHDLAIHKSIRITLVVGPKLDDELSSPNSEHVHTGQWPVITRIRPRQGGQ